MHAGFAALRDACPMNMRRHYDGFAPSAEVAADLARLADIWAHARARATQDGPYLFGAFSAADAFFAPVASRIETYGLALAGADDVRYVQALLDHPSVRRWRAMALADGHVQPRYEFDLAERTVPQAMAATGRVVTGVAAENEFCPFSGRDVVADGLVEIGGRVIGFCNPFCRDKVATDPMAWPEVAALLGQAAQPSLST